jgi:hypothetical protein
MSFFNRWTIFYLSFKNWLVRCSYLFFLFFFNLNSFISIETFKSRRWLNLPLIYFLNVFNRLSFLFKIDIRWLIGHFSAVVTLPLLWVNLSSFELKGKLCKVWVF